MSRAALALVVLAACGPPPAAYIHVTTGEADRSHEVLGAVAVPVEGGLWGTRDDDVRQRLREAARPLGADAVVRARVVRTASGGYQALGLAIRRVRR